MRHSPQSLPILLASLIFLTVAGQDATAQPPLSCWPAEGTAADALGGNHGVLVGPVGFVPAHAGSGFDFQSSGTRVRVPHPTDGSLDFGAGSSFSFGAWIRTESLATAEVMEKQSSPFNSQNLFQLMVLANGTVQCGIADGSTLVQFPGTTPVNDGEFHHCMCVRDAESGDLIIYVDGVEDARREDTTTGTLANSQDLVLGGPRDLTTRNFEGTIDEAQIYPRALSEAEVLSLAQSDSSCSVPAAPTEARACWPAEGTPDDANGQYPGAAQGALGYRSGHTGTGFDFSGTGVRVVVPDPADGSLDFGANDSFSFGAWIQTTSSDLSEVIEKQASPDHSSNLYQMMIREDGTVQCGIGDTSTLVQFAGSTPVNDGELHHCMCVRDVEEDALIIYVDGREDGRREDVTTGSLANSSELVFGGPRNLTTRNFFGLIDDVQIFTRALSPADAQSLARSGESCPTPGFSAVGTVSSDCAGAVEGATIDVFDRTSGELVLTSRTDAEGSFLIQDLPNADYSVVLVAPLGMLAEVEEVTLSASPLQPIEFHLSCLESTGAPSGTGYWKHQLGTALRGQGQAQIDAQGLCDLLDEIQAHFSGNLQNPVSLYDVPPSADCGSKMSAASSLLNLKGRQEMSSRARQHLLALLLNVAAGHLSLFDPADPDGAVVSQAITFVDGSIEDPTGDHATAKHVAETLNRGGLVTGGVIPSDTEIIAYRQGKPSGNSGAKLGQNHPNPFNPATSIAFHSPRAGRVRLDIYDSRGRRILTLLDEDLQAGNHVYHWDGRDDAGRAVHAGVYFYRFQTQGIDQARKMVLVE